MLSIGQIPAAGLGYYSRDDYYSKDITGDIKGEYLGTSPALLGLNDPERDFPHLLKGEHPDGRSLVGDSPKEHRPGLDLTLSAPKSVSILALIAKDERAIAAHDAAVRRTMEFVEREFIRARETRDGQTKHVNTGNLTAIGYRHETTRPIEGTPDPQLHTHVVLLNVTQRPDGEWRAISNELILDNQKVIDAAYKSYLERGLHDLGYATDRTANGFEVRGIPSELISAFSRRHKDILRSMSVHPDQTSRDAALHTREPKSHELDPAARHDLWLERAAAHGHTSQAIAASVAREGERARAERSEAAGQASGPPQGPPTGPARMGEVPEPGHEIDRVIAALERDTAWWTRDDLFRTAAPYLRAELTPEDFSRQITAAEDRGDLMRLGEGRYTSPDALLTERNIVGLAAQDRPKSEAHPDIQRPSDQAISDRWAQLNPGQTPTAEQVEAVGFLVSSEQWVIGLQGPPGAGKTSALGVAHDLWREQGYTVTGLAQVKQVAETLEGRTGIPSQTIEGYLQQQTHSGPSASSARQILVIDEAAGVGSRNMLDLLKSAQDVDKVVLVGDTRQLEPIGAGKPFEDLASRGLVSAAILTQIQRQDEGTLRDAISALHATDAPRAVALLDSMGAIHEQQEKDPLTGKAGIPIKTMAADFASLDPERRAETLVQVPTHRHREAFNAQVREHLKARGEIDATSERTYEVWRPLNLSHAEKLDPSRYPEGGIVEFFRAKPDQQIPQGARGVIEGVTVDHKLGLRFPADGGRRLTFGPVSHWKFNVYEPRELKVAVGDTLIFGKNDKELGVTNGTRSQVVALDENSITLRPLKTDRLVTVDPRQYSYLDHGFASTIHKSQGQTVPRVMVGINPEDRHETANRSYTAITRAAQDVKIYTPDKAGLVRSMSEWAAHRSVMAEALGEKKADPSPPPPPPTKDPDQEKGKGKGKEEPTLGEEKEKVDPGKNLVTAEIFRYETKDFTVLVPAGTPLTSLREEVRLHLQTSANRETTSDKREDRQSAASSLISEPFKYETPSLSRTVPAGTSVDQLLDGVAHSVRTKPGPEHAQLDQRGQQALRGDGPGSPALPASPGVSTERTGTGNVYSPTPPVIPTPDQERKKDVSPSERTPSNFSSWPEQTAIPPVIPTPDHGREAARPSQSLSAGPSPPSSSLPSGPHRADGDQLPGASTGQTPGYGSHGSSSPRGGPVIPEYREPSAAKAKAEDQRPLNRMGRILYGPDRLRETFGPKGWKATAFQPNQLMAKARYILQAPTFGEGLKRMTHHVHAVRFQKTWTGRSEAIGKASGAWGKLKAAVAPTAKTVYFVTESFRGTRHAARIASTPSVGSAVRRIFERIDRMYDPKTQQFIGGAQPGVARDREPHQAQGKRTNEERQTRGPAPTQAKPSQEKAFGEKTQRQGPARGESQGEERAASSGGPKRREAADQGKNTHQNNRLTFQQESSGNKGKKSKEEIER